MSYKILEKTNDREVVIKCTMCDKKILIGKEIFIVGQGEGKDSFGKIWNTWGKCCSRNCADDLVYDWYYGERSKRVAGDKDTIIFD